MAAKIIAFLAILVALLTVLNSILRKGSSKPKDFPYRKKEYLLNGKESNIFNILRDIVGNDLELFTKVNLSKLITIGSNVKNYNSHLRRLRSYNIDYILCNPVNYSPILAIISENAKDRNRYDELYQILNSANIKFITLQSNKVYDIHEMSSLLRETIGQVGEVAINS